MPQDRRRVALPEDWVLDLHDTSLPGADLSGGNLRYANFAGTNFTKAKFRDTDLKDANLKGTILRGADLTGARNLTVEQLREAVIDDTTILPDDIAAALKADLPEHHGHDHA